jgi:three-Cys-motif partner protein
MAEQSFGGEWTETKLRMLREYLESYLTVLKKQPFTLHYIDAFAGTGYRTETHRVSVEEQGTHFLDAFDEQSTKFMDGSARIALGLESGFNCYHFVEKDPARFSELEKLKTDFPDRSRAIELIQQDANGYLLDLCGKQGFWRNNRAVLFLDPFGMQVDWTTMKAIAETKAMDVWILFPLGIAVNRMLTKDANIPKAWVEILDRVFGEHGWHDAFYERSVELDLLNGTQEFTRKTADFKAIGDYYVQRLKTIFGDKQVSKEPKYLYNSRNIPLFMFCFAAGNSKGAPIALRIANHILRH